MKRTFIAINIPNNQKLGLAKFINKLKQTNSSKAIKYVRPEGLHLTLNFLGLINNTQIEKINEILNKAAAKYPCFNLQTSELNAFPNLKNPRVLFLKTTGDNYTSSYLQKFISHNLKQAGFFVDLRPWKSHLTVARIKKPIKLKLNTNPPKIKFSVTSIELMQSILSPGGANYSIISSHKLIK